MLTFASSDSWKRITWKIFKALFRGLDSSLIPLIFKAMFMLYIIYGLYLFTYITQALHNLRDCKTLGCLDPSAKV